MTFTQVLNAIGLLPRKGEPRVCPCGHVNPDHARFCGKCGLDPLTLPPGTLTRREDVDKSAQRFTLGTRQVVWWGYVFHRKVKLCTLEHKRRGWGTISGDYYWAYECPTCRNELTPGPSGGGTNQVCEPCRVNYGGLPGALER